MILVSQIVVGGMSFAQIAVAIIICLAVVGIVVVATKAMGVPVPDWVWKIVGIVVVACVAILAIRFLLGM